MSSKTYNPYNAVKRIVDLKGDYHTAKELGGDYKQYQTAAAQYYDELAKNGKQDIADRLVVSNYTQAKDILAEFKEDTTVDDFYNELAKVGTGDKSTANDQYSAWVDDLMKVSTGKAQTTPSQHASDLLDMVKGNDSIYNDSYSEIQNRGLSDLDKLLDYDYTKQSFYQPIMDTYKLYGDDAADGALAVGAGANGGNIDSYAAANANRQQLAFTNAGHQAALAAAQQNQGSYLDLYNAISGNLDNLRLKNADITGTYESVYGKDSEERKAAANTLAGIYSTDSSERQNAVNAMVDKYLADLGLVKTQYTTDADERMNTANNEYGLGIQGMQNEIEKYLGDLGYSSDLAGYASQERMNTANNSANLTLAQKEHENALELADREHTNALAMLDRENKYSGAAGVLKTTIESEVPYYMELVGKDPALSSVNDVRALLLEEYGASNKDTIDNAINTWLKYNKTTSSDSGATVTEAERLAQSAMSGLSQK